MRSQHVSNARAIARRTLLAGASVLAFGALVSAATLIASSREATAKPEFAVQTKLPCGQCHVNPAGGGKLKAFGEKFKANGFKLK